MFEKNCRAPENCLLFEPVKLGAPIFDVRCARRASSFEKKLFELHRKLELLLILEKEKEKKGVCLGYNRCKDPAMFLTLSVPEITISHHKSHWRKLGKLRQKLI